MPLRRPLLALLVTVVAMLPLHPRLGAAASTAPCPAGTVCDPALGIALTLQPSWVRLMPPKVPEHTMALATSPGTGQDYNIRLQIAPWGRTVERNDVKAAQVGVDRLIGGFRTRLYVSRAPVRYGGAPGVLIRGLPPTPHPAVDIVLAHAGSLYLIIAPGSSLAPDQHATLASIRFIPRQGPFPSANPSAPVGSSSRRTVQGGAFADNALTLTRTNGIRRGMHTYSLWFAAQKGWVLAYSVPCSGPKGQLLVSIVDLRGEVLDRVLHRLGATHRVQQVEYIGGSLRLDVQSRCPRWTVKASNVRG